jgi:hypothetical protein
MPMKRLIVSLVFITLAAASVYAGIIYVPTDSLTIQAGINGAVNGDTVLVEPGIYHENINFRSKGITVASRFLLTWNTAYLDSTVILGLTPVNPDTGSCVLITSSNPSTFADTSAVLAGFTITGGSGTKWLDEHGAGTFREGGGVLVEYLSPRIHHNIIVDNSATDISGLPANHAGGGGLRCGDGNPHIENNIIVYNSGLYGGGIVLNFTGALVRNNIIAHNNSASAYLGGGGIWINGNSANGAAQIVNNTLVSNQSPISGSVAGGIAIYAGSPGIRNSIIWGNTGFFEIYSQTGTQPAYCDIEGGYPGTGNIDNDPSFTDINYFYLADTSDCIDAGDPDASYSDPENPLNPMYAMWPAQGGLRNDMGAYGGPGSFSFEGSVVSVEPQPEIGIPANITFESYPNPFNAGVTLRYNIPGATEVSLQIFNSQGQEIINLPAHDQRVGSGFFNWEGKDNVGIPAASGIYLCRLNSSTRTLTSRIVLLK